MSAKLKYRVFMLDAINELRAFVAIVTAQRPAAPGNGLPSQERRTGSLSEQAQVARAVA
jgi:hypothetical protein